MCTFLTCNTVSTVNFSIVICHIYFQFFITCRRCEYIYFITLQNILKRNFSVINNIYKKAIHQMLSIKRLPTLSASKIQSKVYFHLRNGGVEKQISKYCHYNLFNICRSMSVLHSLTNKSRNPVSIL